ncbi:phospho-N-acetylmuramoyl-pentapeptide-transferase [bacterium]|nr:phospho-N-acetylmuramoyl-pentapeptide-transferase [bacterium]
MLYYLHHLQDAFGPLRLFAYWSFRSMGAFITAFGVCLVLGPPLTRLLKRHGACDPGREFGVLNVASKEGTPTMGGLLILAGLFSGALLWCDLGCNPVRLVLGAAAFFGMLGALDDLKKARDRTSDGGLSRRAKYAAQILFGGLIAASLHFESLSPYAADTIHRLTVPVWRHGLALGWLYLPFVVVFMVLASNSVNVTDGLDGLAVVPSMMVALVLGIFAYVAGDADVAGFLRFEHLPGAGELTVVCSALIGAGAGFLWFNSHPASLFMGDTGSLALGGMLGTLALLTKQEIVFFIAGGIFVVEAGSSFIQDYIGLKLLGRRLFFRAPYHHSLMHQGLSETKVTVRFWILSAIFAVMALLTLKLR